MKILINIEQSFPDKKIRESLKERRICIISSGKDERENANSDQYLIIFL